MKRTTTIATALAAAVLIGGGSYSALATTGGGHRHGTGAEDRPTVTASASAPSASSAPAAPSTSSAPVSMTAAQAAAAARKAFPGTVTEVEPDRHHPGSWKVHLVGADNVRREVRVDPRTGAVTLDRRGGGDDRPGDDHGRGRGRGGHGGDDH
ncbi:PepSY domain-containing protein [Streptomyces sp. NPDC046977]|uniref:PepSY domain-containing protein n=1 Tax=Streptomyces sp. NPDC046977 TaxID=3154703 RepID=UPI0033E7C69C